MNIDNLGFGGQILFVALGVAASVLIPVLLAAGPKRRSGLTRLKSAWSAAKPYLALAVASLLVAFVVLAIFRSQGNDLKEWWQAFLAGYVSDSTLQKFKDGGS
jgi:hypothetical protein